MAAASMSFQQIWRIGRQVQEIAAPRRTGTIRARTGTGANAQITVSFKGGVPTDFRPAQLTPL